MPTTLDIRRLELAERIRELEEALQALRQEQQFLADCVPATDETGVISNA